MAVLADPSDEHLMVGLMSGTSADGIDAALVRIQGAGADASLSLVAHDTLTYSHTVRARIQSCQGSRGEGTRETVLLDAYLGELFAHAALHICKKAGVSPTEVLAAGCHGQTLYHHPHSERLPGFSVRGTLQIGNPAVIAERTGLTVVSHFRSRDMAAGGQGAPLVPLLDYLLYHHTSRGRIALNIGGIANLTAIPADAGPDRILAFDAGPGNCLMDLALRRATQGRSSCDVDGAWASAGRVQPALLDRLLAHPFLKAPPPKSADKDTFGADFLDGALTDFPGIPPKDLLATLAALTVRAIAASMMEFVFQKERYEEVIVSGGGARNPVLMRGLEAALPRLMVSRADDYVIPGSAKEAVLMAYLAHETLLGRHGNLPAATGASRPVVLGSITPGSGFFAGG
jgi:anhydro-N-acetylmuramic acid kinase